MELIWKVIAKIVSIPFIADMIIKQAQKTEYFHLPGYMERWWLFNGYGKDKAYEKKYSWLPAIRVHRILREDRGIHPHDHPWDARTIILKGWYTELRLADTLYNDRVLSPNIQSEFPFEYPQLYWVCDRQRGDTATIKFGEYHHISQVSPETAWTLFFTWKYCGKWGFLVDGKKVPHDEYTEER